ncbi:MAG: FmdE family protein [Pseudoflavonifractor sp.]
MNQALWEKCVAFHGHACPGLAIGYRASEQAMEQLGLTGPSADEELVCITENDACGVDAVQVITSCTMGKGNLLYHGTGKMAFSFYCRNSGRSVRLVLKPLPETMDRAAKQQYILTAPPEAVFWIKPTVIPLPERARHFGNLICAVCGEPVPEHKIRLQDGKPLCPDCYAPYERGW